SSRGRHTRFSGDWSSDVCSSDLVGQQSAGARAMERRGDEVHMNETEASGGSKEGVVRWVLIVGTFLAIAFLTIIWVTGALTQDEAESQVSVERRIQAQQPNTDTDSIVDDRVDEIDAPEGGDSPADEPGRVGT